jgi:hypothetical protein
MPNEDFDETDKQDLDFTIQSMYIGRNYYLFGILAGVRNGLITPIAEPKGLPKDVSKPIKELSERWNGDGHSHTWLSLKELLDYNWTESEETEGYVNGYVYNKWNYWLREQGLGPENYFEHNINGRLNIISEDEMNNKINNIDTTQRPNKTSNEWDDYKRKILSDVYCKCYWIEKKYHFVNNLFKQIIPELLGMSKDGTYEDVRCVFWFDN